MALRDSLTKQHEAEMDSMRWVHEATIEEMLGEAEQKLASERQQSHEALEAVRLQHEASSKASHEEAEKALALVHSQHQEAIERLLKEHSEKWEGFVLEQTNNELESSALLSAQIETLEGERQEHTRAVQAMRQEHEEKIQSLQGEHSVALGQLKAGMESSEKVELCLRNELQAQKDEVTSTTFLPAFPSLQRRSSLALCP